MSGSARTRRSPVWLDAQQPLARWYATGLGESILTQLEDALAARLGDVFGYQGLQVGNLAGGRDLLASAGLHRRLMLDSPGNAPIIWPPGDSSAERRTAESSAAGTHAADASAADGRAVAVPAVDGRAADIHAASCHAADASAASCHVTDASAADGHAADASAAKGHPADIRTADIHADVTALPIASGSMKAVLFFHTLDFCAHPHQALREADRVLTDDGQLVIIGFNPFSAFGIRHFLSGWRGREPWNGRFYSRGRVGDWLSVLDYRVLDSHAMFIRPPFNSERLLRRLGGLERLEPWFGALGGLYIVRARKQRMPMTLVRRQWRSRRAGIAAAGLARSGEDKPVSNVARVDFRKR